MATAMISQSCLCVCSLSLFFFSSISYAIPNAEHRMPQLRPLDSWGQIPREKRGGFAPMDFAMESMDLYFLPRTVTPCGDFSCQNGANCTLNGDGSFAACDCDGDHVGLFCQCEGAEGDDPCQTVGVCGVDGAGTCVWDCSPDPTCRCNDGFVLNSDDICEDVDECSTQPDICASQPNTVCVNMEGSHQCDCQDGFEETEGVCQRNCPGGGWVAYGESCYLAPSPSLKPTEARDICHGYNSDLVCEVQDEAELAFIGLSSLGTTWLGYSDSGHEGKYVCPYDTNDSFDGTTGKPPLQWLTFEPNGAGGENCVALVHNQWASVDCNTEHNFVCELMNPMEEPCPDGWTEFTANGASSCYWSPPGKSTFWTASQFCKLSVPESDLMIVDSERENEVLASWYGFLENSGPTYIGFRQKDPGSTSWTWIGQGTPSPFTNWLEGMPTNEPGFHECAVLVPSKMKDVACSEQHKFLCKSNVG